MKTTNFKTLSLALFAATMLTLTGCDKSGTPSGGEGIVGVDRTAPVITLVGGDITMDEDNPYVEPGATAVDNIDGTVPVVITGTVDTATPGVYILTYTATDSSANESSVTRTVTVSDITAPVISLVGGDITMDEDNPYVEPGATAVDNIDGTVPVVITGTVDTATPGVYILTYTATDSSANESSVTRTVTVSDITAPVISLQGDANVALSIGDNYTEAGATAVDNVDGPVAVVITGTVNTATPGVYILTYTATDSSSNTSSVTRTVNVVGPAPLAGNITIDKAALQTIIASIFDNTPYDPAINVQGTISVQGLTVYMPYTVSNAQVTLKAYSTSVTLDANATEDDEAGIVATFAWEEQILSVGSGTFTATITIDDSAGNDDNIYKAKRLDIEDDILGLVAATFPYATDNVGGLGTLTLKIMPGIPDRMFNIADNTGDDTTHMFLYLPVTNPTTGKTWLNNNLGSNYANTNSPAFNPAQQAIASNDHNAYGSLFQWGRKADGHELINWSSGSAGTAVNGTISTPSDDPSDALFIIVSPDWRVTRDDTLWASESSANNVCPVGYRVPTGGELALEGQSWGSSDAVGALASTLVLTMPGYHDNTTEYVYSEATYGYYWGSTIVSSTSAASFYFTASSLTHGSSNRSFGMSVRCIKD